MSKARDMTGFVFGRLTVIGRAGNDGYGKAMWNCVCSCGATLEVVGANLRYGNSNSCGCFNRDRFVMKS